MGLIQYMSLHNFGWCSESCDGCLTVRPDARTILRSLPSNRILYGNECRMMTAKMGERDSTEEILKAFRLFDDDETGKISFKNLKRVAKELGENMTDEELQVNL